MFRCSRKFPKRLVSITVSGAKLGELPADEKWLYLFTRAAEMEPKTLAELLRDPPYREACCGGNDSNVARTFGRCAYTGH